MADQPTILIFRSLSRNFPVDLPPELEKAGYKVVILRNFEDYISCSERSRPFLAVLEIGSRDDIDRGLLLFDWSEAVQPLAASRFLLLMASKHISLGDRARNFKSAEIAVLPQPIRNLLFKLELQQRLLSTKAPSGLPPMQGFHAALEENRSTTPWKRVMVLRGQDEKAGYWNNSGLTPSGKVRWRWIKNQLPAVAPDAYEWTATSAEAPKFDKESKGWLLEEDGDLVCVHGKEEIYSARKAVGLPAHLDEEEPSGGSVLLGSLQQESLPVKASTFQDKRGQGGSPSPSSGKEAAGKADPISSGAAREHDPLPKEREGYLVKDKGQPSTSLEKMELTKKEARDKATADKAIDLGSSTSREKLPPEELRFEKNQPSKTEEKTVSLGAGKKESPPADAHAQEAEISSDSPKDGSNSSHLVREKSRAPKAPSSLGEIRTTAEKERGTLALGPTKPSSSREKSPTAPAPPASKLVSEIEAITEAAEKLAHRHREENALPSLGEAVPEISSDYKPAEESEAPPALENSTQKAKAPKKQSEPPIEALVGESSTEIESLDKHTRSAIPSSQSFLAKVQAEPSNQRPDILILEKEFKGSVVDGSNPDLSPEDPLRVTWNQKESPIKTEGSATIKGGNPREESETTSFAASQKKESQYTRPQRYFVLMKLSELGDQDSTWRPVGSYRIYLSAQHSYFGAAELSKILPLWLYAGELPPEFIAEENSWKFYDRSPVKVTSLDSLPREIFEFVYKLSGLEPPSDPLQNKKASEKNIPAPELTSQAREYYLAESKEKKGAWNKIKSFLQAIFGR